MALHDLARREKDTATESELESETESETNRDKNQKKKASNPPAPKLKYRAPSHLSQTRAITVQPSTTQPSAVLLELALELELALAKQTVYPDCRLVSISPSIIRDNLSRRYEKHSTVRLLYSTLLYY